LARKILLADDSVTAQNMGRKILTDAGYEVVTVNNGSAALKKIAEGKPDLIVLDVYMPGYSGLEVCQRIKENRETARIPILLTVGKLEPFKPEEARRARADAFVVKPFEASELLSALSKLEDKIIPGAEPYRQGRFAKAVASVDQESDEEKFGDSDSGWKARLRIPMGKPKNTESPVDYAATQGKGFRDYVEPASKNAPPPPPKPSAPPERPLPTGIPHDITPEEIAAITAAAAQVNGIAPPVVYPETSLKEAAAAESAVVEAARESLEEGAPVTFASSPALAEATAVSGDVQTAAAGPQDSPQLEAVVETSSPEAVVTAIETAPETASVIEGNAVAAEPMARPVAQSEEPAEEVGAATAPATEVDESSAVASVRETLAPASVEVIHAAPSETAPEVVVPPATANTSDDEVMAALQTLIPSSETAGSIGVDSPSTGMGTTFPAHSAHPRWMAEQVNLATDEATISLEQEMAAAYGTFSGHGAHTSATASYEVSVPPSESIATAPEPENIEQPAVHALASAAAVGEGAPAFSVTAAHTSSETPVTAHSAETATSIPEVAQVTASPLAELAQEASHSIEGEVMAESWKNIRDSIAGGVAKPAPAKEDFREVEMASSGQIATAAAEQATSKLKASDPTAIANIVDSVLAELRPKIVEEIARKLANPKKE
jgi:CheY-like chemotaxis protein